MKRIPSKIAVQTLNYILRPNQLVTIMDYDNLYNLSNDIDGKVVFDDENSELVGYKYYKILACQIIEMKPKHNKNNTDILEIRICSCLEDF